MEEEKKIEETSKEVEQLGITTKEDDSKKPFLEQRPYHNKYKSDVDIEATATAQSKDTEGTDEIQEATPEKEERPVNAEDKVFKKRYDDLKRHYDSALTKHKSEVLTLKKQLENSATFIPPKDEKALEEWRKEYPDVYDVIKTVAQKEADDKAKALADKLSKLEVDQQTVAKQKAEVELLQLHPDFNKIRESQDFHDWASVQDSVIQGWLYDNFNNSQLASRAIDLYKMDRGLKKSDAKKESAKEASKSVTSTNRGSEKDVKGKKVWSLTEIAKLKPSQYAKFEKDIDLARAEGRITN
jgi:hypothetical protein|tara:strand:- start:779 stop:1672 length:894 start_codon:yes stop_codon:yes gene_type:complete